MIDVWRKGGEGDIDLDAWKTEEVKPIRLIAPSEKDGEKE